MKKSRSEAIWQRFRAACDHFFDRYKNRDEHARQAAQDAREGICAELEALLPAEGARRPSRPPTSCARLQAAQTAWRQAGGLPHDQMAALDERFSARARPAPRGLPPRLRGHRPRPGGEPPQGREARRPRRGPPRGAAPGRRRAPAAERGGARRAAARRARLQHDRRPRGGRGEVALGLGRGRVGAGGVEAPRPGAGGGGPRPLGPLRAGLPALLRAAAEAESRSGRAATGRGRAPGGALARASTGPTGASGRAPVPARRAAPGDVLELFVLARRPGCSLVRRRADPRHVPQRARPRPLPAARRRGRRPLAAHHPRPRADARRPGGPGAVHGRSRPGKELRELGRDLFEVLFPGDVRRLYDTARALRGSGVARRRLHLDARLGGGQAVGARLRPLPPRVPRHVLRQLRPQRLHRRPRGRAPARPGPAAHPGRRRAAAGGGAPRREDRDDRPAQGLPRPRGRRPRHDRGPDEGDRGPPAAPPRRRRASTSCTSSATATSTSGSARGRSSSRTSGGGRGRSAPTRCARSCAGAACASSS